MLRIFIFISAIIIASQGANAKPDPAARTAASATIMRSVGRMSDAVIALSCQLRTQSWYNAINDAIFKISMEIGHQNVVELTGEQYWGDADAFVEGALYASIMAGFREAARHHEGACKALATAGTLPALDAIISGSPK